MRRKMIEEETGIPAADIGEYAEFSVLRVMVAGAFCFSFFAHHRVKKLKLLFAVIFRVENTGFHTVTVIVVCRYLSVPSALKRIM